ncbi:MAG: hypothetical protein KY455_13480 [Euryarchaeota archaeon]|nr:hypothetical protein [Euryarchaeota archaeon]
MERIDAVTTTLTTEVTLKSDHLSYVHAALVKAGWTVEGKPEWVTTDEGYDDEVKLRVKMQVLLDDLKDAPKIERPSEQYGTIGSLLVA